MFQPFLYRYRTLKSLVLEVSGIRTSGIWMITVLNLRKVIRIIHDTPPILFLWCKFKTLIHDGLKMGEKDTTLG